MEGEGQDKKEDEFKIALVKKAISSLQAITGGGEGRGGGVREGEGEEGEGEEGKGGGGGGGGVSVLDAYNISRLAVHSLHGGSPESAVELRKQVIETASIMLKSSPDGSELKPNLKHNPQWTYIMLKLAARVLHAGNSSHIPMRKVVGSSSTDPHSQGVTSYRQQKNQGGYHQAAMVINKTVPAVPVIPTSLNFVSPTYYLINKDASCFIDVIIDMIMSIFPLVELLITEKNRIPKGKAPLIHYLANLILSLHAVPGRNITILASNDMKDAFFQVRENKLREKNHEKFFKKTQEDASEFFISLIDKVNEELFAHYPLQKPTRCEMLSEGCLIRTYTRECNHTSHVREIFQEIRINLKGEDGVDLKQEINNTLNEKEVFTFDDKNEIKKADGDPDNRAVCSDCTTNPKEPVKQKTEKVTKPLTLPPVLHVLIVRQKQGSFVERTEAFFDLNKPQPALNYDQEMEPQKILTAVTYDEEMDLLEHREDGTTSSVTYDLHSCVLTSPDRSLRFGHFKGYFKYNRLWYLSDDLTVTSAVKIRNPVDITEVLKHKKVIYMLTYIRKLDANVEMSSGSPLSSSSSSGHDVKDTNMIIEQLSSTDTLVATSHDDSSNAAMDTSTHSSLANTVIPLSLASTAIPPPTAISNNSLSPNLQMFPKLLILILMMYFDDSFPFTTAPSHDAFSFSLRINNLNEYMRVTLFLFYITHV